SRAAENRLFRIAGCDAASHDVPTLVSSERDAMEVNSIIRIGSALLALLLCHCTYAQAPGAPPNIFLIVADDFGVDVTSDMYPGLIDDLSKRYGPDGHGHPRHEVIDGRPASTPRLNDLAQQGMAFTNVWAQPFCSPTRASILTGLFAS